MKIKLNQKSDATVEVSYAQGLTMTKNYQSTRVDAGIKLICGAGEISDTFERAKKIVERQLELSVEGNKGNLEAMSQLLK